MKIERTAKEEEGGYGKEKKNIFYETVLAEAAQMLTVRTNYPPRRSTRCATSDKEEKKKNKRKNGENNYWY